MITKPGTKSLLVRLAVFLMVAGGLFTFTFRNMFVQRTRLGDSVALADVGVSITWSPDGSTTVKVDDRQQTIPKGRLADAPLYQEAMRRVSSRLRARLGEQYSGFSWRLFTRLWLGPAVVVYLVVFHIWPRPRPYIEGPIA